MASKSKKKPLTTSSDGDESQQRSEGASEDAESAPVLPVISDIDTNFSSNTRIPAVVVRIDSSLLMIRPAQQLFIFILLS